MLSKRWLKCYNQTVKRGVFKMCMTDEMEVPLTGGRITQGVVKKGNVVLRPQGEHAELVHQVLLFLQEKNVGCVAHFYGIDEQNREILSFLPGTCPNELDDFSEEQCCQAAKIIRLLHETLREFPNCEDGQVVCHNDLSPCNFIFQNGLPYAVIDWDALSIGDPVEDLAYAIWLWLDMGYEQRDVVTIGQKMKQMLDTYGLKQEQRTDFLNHILMQMQRIERFGRLQKRHETTAWAEKCQRWLKEHWHLLACYLS